MQDSAVLCRAIRVCLSEGVTFKQRTDQRQRVRHAETWQKALPAEQTAHPKALSRDVLDMF